MQQSLRSEARLRDQNFAEPKVKLFCTKIVSFRPRAAQTDATQACHREGLRGRASSRWTIFVILRQK